jgi:hypothetical protein
MANPNFQLLVDAAKLLKPILGELVFVGGCTRDVIAVVDGRGELVGEIQASAGDVRSYLAKELKKLISNREFTDALPGHLPPDAASQERVATVISRLEEIASL